jgi:hypothetical protein
MKKLMISVSLGAALLAPSIKADCSSAVANLNNALIAMEWACDDNNPNHGDECPAASYAAMQASYDVDAQCNGGE